MATGVVCLRSGDVMNRLEGRMDGVWIKILSAANRCLNDVSDLIKNVSKFVI
jgi:hypothetical protein